MKNIKRAFSKHFTALAALMILLFTGLACNSRSDAEWTRILADKKLSMAKTSGSISDKVNIWFCPSGEYVMQKQFTGFSTGGGGTLSMADEDVEYGRWQILSSTLVLRAQSGERTEFLISQGFEENVVSLDNDDYLVTSHAECGN
jgi:uncharacterized lipoprotein NlpE involved in copper resistance